MKKYLMMMMLAIVPMLFVSCSDKDDETEGNKIVNLSKAEFEHLSEWVGKSYQEVMASGKVGEVQRTTEGEAIFSILHVDGVPYNATFSFLGGLSKITLNQIDDYAGKKYDTAAQFANFKKYADQAHTKYGEPDQILYSALEKESIQVSYDTFWNEIHNGSTDATVSFRFPDGYDKHIYHWQRTREGKYYFGITISFV